MVVHIFSGFALFTELMRVYRSCEVLNEKYRIAVQGIFLGIIIKASAASLKAKRLVVCLRFL